MQIRDFLIVLFFTIQAHFFISVAGYASPAKVTSSDSSRHAVYMRVSICWWFRLSHSSTAAIRSSCNVDGGSCRLQIALLSWSHACSMGFISGEVGGHSILSISTSLRYSEMIWARWDLALLSCKVKLLSYSWWSGSTTGIRTSSRYFTAVNMPSTLTSGVLWP